MSILKFVKAVLSIPFKIMDDGFARIPYLSMSYKRESKPYADISVTGVHLNGHLRYRCYFKCKSTYFIAA